MAEPLICWKSYCRRYCHRVYKPGKGWIRDYRSKPQAPMGNFTLECLSPQGRFVQASLRAFAGGRAETYRGVSEQGRTVYFKWTITGHQSSRARKPYDPSVAATLRLIATDWLRDQGYAVEAEDMIDSVSALYPEDGVGPTTYLKLTIRCDS